MSRSPEEKAPLALAVFGPILLPSNLVAFAKEKPDGFVRAALSKLHPGHDWSKKEGCYVFALQNQSAPVPYYAGKANRPLYKECVTPRNLLNYEDAANRFKGTALLFFIAAARPTKNDLDAALIEELEAELIRLTVRSNPKRAINVHGAIGKRRPYFVKGISELSYTSKVGKGNAASSALASMFFASPKVAKGHLS